MKQYLDLCEHIIHNGTQKGDRTGTGTLSVFGYQMRFDLSKGFPAVTTKKLNLKAVIHELLWFLKGDTNIKYLVDNGVNIWNPDAHREYKKKVGNFNPMNLEQFKNSILLDQDFAYEFGDLGPVYGAQWRGWVEGYYEDDMLIVQQTIDQITNVINDIKSNPDSRRLIVSAWNPVDLPWMALPPCHCLFQFYVLDGKLSLQLYQRSGDVFLGVPFNISSYALLLIMVAQVTGLEVGEFVHTLGDAHIYNNHLEQVKLQLTREPLELPKMVLNKDIKNIFDFKYEDFSLEDYDSYDAIKGDISV